MKGIFAEFKKFALRGNVMDMAVGIIIGAAFGKIVDSLVKDIIMPPLGYLMGKVDFANMYLTIVGDEYPSLAEAQKAGAVTVNYGLFLNTIISFIIVAFSVFLLIKIMNTVQAKLEAKEAKEAAKAEPTTKKCPFCCTDIPLAATRCPHCTSELETAKKKK